jgi:L-gulono-1,4-lactone dehydrogenase
LLDDMRDDGYANVSYKVFNIGEANHLPAYSMELGVGLENGRHIECIDRLLEIAAERRKRERLVHTSPIALRFVAPSRAFASMMHERLADLGVRPHWGQINSLTPERVARLYPRWPEWLAVECRLDASGVFDSPFTARVGISSSRPGPPAPATPGAA